MESIDPESSHARRAAVRRAFLVGGACAAGCLAFGKPAANATADGFIVALGGLIAWATYHLVSGRTDGLTLAAMNTLPIWREPGDPWLPTLVITSMAMLGVGLVMGLVNRPEARGETSNDDLDWWDPEFDGPA